MVLFERYEVGGKLQPSTFFNLNIELFSSGGTRVTLFLINILLALAWIALTGHFTATNLIIGLALGYLTLWITQRNQSTTAYFVKLRRVIGFVIITAPVGAHLISRAAYRTGAPLWRGTVADELGGRRGPGKAALNGAGSGPEPGRRH